MEQRKCKKLIITRHFISIFTHNLANW